MKRIALKIDVDTYPGARHGVPALSDQLQRHQAGATFFFTLGPDYSGCENRQSPARYYPFQSRLYGRYWPAPEIGKACADILRGVAAAGFEIGIHGWNRIFWERKIGEKNAQWAENDLFRACARYAELFSNKPQAHAAPGWLTLRHTLRLTQRLGLSYASDSRGCHPYIPVIDGELVACPQLPTTLPTLDELLVLEPRYSPEQAVDRIAQLANAIAGDHVFTLRAELEGMKFIDAFERLLGVWKSDDLLLVPLRDIRATLDPGALPRHTVSLGNTPGRNGARLTQGNAFLWQHIRTA